MLCIIFPWYYPPYNHWSTIVKVSFSISPAYFHSYLTIIHHWPSAPIQYWYFGVSMNINWYIILLRVSMSSASNCLSVNLSLGFIYSSILPVMPIGQRVYYATLQIMPAAFFKGVIRCSRQVLNSSPYRPSRWVRMFLIMVTFFSGVYPTMERNTIFSCDVIAHADMAKQNWT